MKKTISLVGLGLVALALILMPLAIGCSAGVEYRSAPATLKATEPDKAPAEATKETGSCKCSDACQCKETCNCAKGDCDKGGKCACKPEKQPAPCCGKTSCCPSQRPPQPGFRYLKITDCHGAVLWEGRIYGHVRLWQGSGGAIAHAEWYTATQGVVNLSPMSGTMFTIEPDRPAVSPVPPADE